MPEFWEARSEQLWRRHLTVIRQTDRELANILMDGAKEAERQAMRLAGDPRIGAAARRAQYRVQAHVLRELNAELWGDVHRTIGKNLELAARLGAEAGNLLSSLMGGIAGYEDLLLAAEFSAENVISRQLNAIDLSPNVYNNRALSSGKIDQIVNNGITSGKSAREIAQAVRGYISPKTPGGVSYAANRLGRTELNNAFHRTTIDMAKRQPWVTGMIWNLSGSHPRSDICDKLKADGPYAVDETPMKPHPQCLCFLTVATLDDATFKRNLNSGQYDDWQIHGQSMGVR